MSQQKRQLKNKIGLVGAICGSLLLSLPALAQTPANRDTPSGTQNGVMCSPNTSDTNMSSSGTSSANSNRNTPTTSANTSSGTMGGRTSASGTNAQSMTREGTSSANSNRNTPTTSTNTSSGTMSDRSSTMMSGRPSTANTSETTVPNDPMSARDPDAVRMDDQAACDTGNSTDMNSNTPSRTSPNRDKQMRRNNY